MQITKRARSQEAKQERIRHIINASSDVLAVKNLNDFTLADVVERTRLSKPAIYNYFPTKEEILLNHSYNTAQIQWFKAGSAMNVLRNKKQS